MRVVVSSHLFHFEPFGPRTPVHKVNDVLLHSLPPRRVELSFRRRSLCAPFAACSYTAGHEHGSARRVELQHSQLTMCPLQIRLSSGASGLTPTGDPKAPRLIPAMLHPRPPRGASRPCRPAVAERPGRGRRSRGRRGEGTGRSRGRQAADTATRYGMCVCGLIEYGRMRQLLICGLEKLCLQAISVDAMLVS